MSPLDWGVGAAAYLLEAAILYALLRHKPGERQEGWIVFTNRQTLGLCLIWPITLSVLIAVAIYTRLPKRPVRGLQYELVDLNDRRDGKFTVGHPVYGIVVVFYTTCTYRQWWRRVLPGLKRRGYRVSYGGEVRLEDSQLDPFIGRIVPIEDMQTFREFMVAEVKRLMRTAHKQET